jgi:branched-chain amino acid transport system permease protein
MFYDSGFLIGLKGFVAAIFGGLASYRRPRSRDLRGPARELRLVLGQRLQGGHRLHRDHPVLLWRSFQHGHADEEE